MMNAVLQRPMFAMPVRRQTGTPEGGETVSSTRTMQGRIDPFKFNLLDKLGVISNKSLGREAPDQDFQINIDDAMTNPKLLNDVFDMIISSTGFDMDLFMNLGASQQEDYLNTIRGKLIFGKAKGGEMKAVGIADGLDQEEKTVDRDPSKEGIAKVSPKQYVELMNEVRGDEVSMEGRVQELATVVGEKDAKDTPLSVLALVQPVFEMKEQQGIAQTQQAQQMGPPMASTQLADPRNMGIVRANTGLIVDAPFDFRNLNLSTSIPNLDSSPVPFTGAPQPADITDVTGQLISDFMEKYVTPVDITSSSIAAEKELLKSLMGDVKGQAKRALAFGGIDKGLRLAQGEDPLTLLRETSADFLSAANAIDKADQAIGLQAYKSLLARKNTMSERQFALAKMGLENQLKIAFEKAKGMTDPVYLKDIKTDTIQVLDAVKDREKIAILLQNNFEIINVKGGFDINIENIIPTQKSQGEIPAQKDGGLVEATKRLREQEIVKRSNGSPEGGEMKLASSEYMSFEDVLKAIEAGEMGVQKEETVGKGGMELIQDKGTIVDYQKRIVLSNELQSLFREAIDLIENNPKLAGLVGDFLQMGQKTILPINQMFDVFGKESPISDRVTKFVSDPDIQRLATLETLIPQKLIDFTKDLDSARIPALNRILQSKADLRISGLSDATVAVNTLKGLLKDVQSSTNVMREAIGRDPVEYTSPINIIIDEFDIDKNDELVQQALQAIELRPELTQKILESLRKKLEQRSGK